MLNLTKVSKKGDTIVEVMLAMTLLTSFLFISWGITNKATQIGINSQKRVDMVNAVKEQAEIIKSVYAKSGYQVDASLTSALPSIATDLGIDACTATQDSAKTFFFSSTLELQAGQVKQIPDAANRVWVQYKPEKDSDPEYYDFYVRSCWQTVGSAQNTDSSQLIVRLNTNAP